MIGTVVEPFGQNSIFSVHHKKEIVKKCFKCSKVKECVKNYLALNGGIDKY